MIFVTVGAQMPFDRMIAAVDCWAGNHLDEECFAQIGKTSFVPNNMRFEQSLLPSEFEQAINDARLVVAHAGMGSILTAMRLCKPILVFPRRGDLCETRNDHQIATIGCFRGLKGVYVAEDEDQLLAQLSALQDIVCPSGISAFASDQLIHTIESFIEQPDS